MVGARLLLLCVAAQALRLREDRSFLGAGNAFFSKPWKKACPSTDAGPDYSSMDSWLAHPMKDGSIGSNFPIAACDKSAESSVATFYLHPTSFFCGMLDFQCVANEVLGDGEDPISGSLKPDMVKVCQALFNGASKVYAPYYRQSSIGAQFVATKDAPASLDDGCHPPSTPLGVRNAAYADAKAAFEAFLGTIGDATKFFVGGHSQGSNLLKRLLHEAVAGKVAGFQKENFLAGYLTGEYTDLGYDAFPECKSSADKGCLVSFASSYSDVSLEKVTMPCGKQTLTSGCNPDVTYCLDDECSVKDSGATASKEAGAMCYADVLSKDGTSEGGEWIVFDEKLKAREMDTKISELHCDEFGALRVPPNDDLVAALGNRFSGINPENPGDLHEVDINIVWAALRRDIHLRAGVDSDTETCARAAVDAVKKAEMPSTLGRILSAVAHGAKKSIKGLWEGIKGLVPWKR